MNLYDDTPETAPPITTKLSQRKTLIQAFRSSREYKTSRANFLRQAKAHRNHDGTVGASCWLCGQPIDYQLRWPHPRCWTLDHAVPVKEDITVMLDMENYRCAHRECNQHRGSDKPPIELGEPSEIW